MQSLAGQIDLARKLTGEIGLDIVIRQDEEFVEVDRYELDGTAFVTHFITGVDRSIRQARIDGDHIGCAWVSYEEALEYDLTPQTRKGLVALAETLNKPLPQL